MMTLSATYPTDLLQHIKNMMHNPQLVLLDSDKPSLEGNKHIFYPILVTPIVRCEAVLLRSTRRIDAPIQNIQLESEQDHASTLADPLSSMYHIL